MFGGLFDARNPRLRKEPLCASVGHSRGGGRWVASPGPGNPLLALRLRGSLRPSGLPDDAVR